MTEQCLYAKEWILTSEFGQEKLVSAEIAEWFGQRGADACRIQDMLTAVSEACLNAAEHGNKLDVRRQVRVSMKVFETKVVFRVTDEGSGFDYAAWTDGRAAPMRVSEKMKEDNPRGWGLYFIAALADDVRFGSEAGAFFTEIEFVKP